MPPGTQVTAIARAAADTPTRNLGPLTTVFTPSPVCSSLFSATLGPKTFGMILGGQCDSNSAVPDASDCCPPAANSDAAISTGDVVNKLHRGYYSPGLYCPAGYTTACSATGTDDYFAASFMYPPGPSDTAIGCCPTGYVIYIDIQVQACFTVYDTAPAAATCVAGTPSLLGSSDGTTQVTAYAPIIQLLRQSSDLSVIFNGPIKPTSSSSSLVPSSLVPSSSEPSQPTSSGTDAPSVLPGSSKHISKGAIAGIVIAVLLVVFAFLGAIVYLFLTRRQRRRAAEGGVSAGAPSVAAASELGTNEMSEMASPSHTPAKFDYFETPQAHTPQLYQNPQELPAGAAQDQVYCGDGPFEMPSQSGDVVNEMPQYQYQELNRTEQ